jgi:hypothetical protein
VSSQEATLFISAARTVTPTATAVACGYALGFHLVIDVTAIGPAPSVVPTVACFDTRSAKWYPIIVGPALVAVGTTVLRCYPGITPVAGLAVADVITEQVRLSMAHGNADSITYSAAIHLVQ